MSAYAVWARPQLAAQVLKPRGSGRSEVALRVDALRDARRVLHLETRLRALAGVTRVAIDAPARRVRIVWDPVRTPLPQILDACAAGGCVAQPLQHDLAADRRAEEMHVALKYLLVAGMCAMQVMSYALVMYVGAVDALDYSTHELFRWLSFLTTLPVVFYSARPFFRGVMRELAARRIGTNLPLALAVALVFAVSAFDTIAGSGEIYFDSVSMLVFLLLGARYVELRSRQRSHARGDAVLDATPWLARRRRGDGSLETVAALELLPGDRVHVAEGEVVPADGTLTAGSVRVDEAVLSGESRPLRRRAGEALLAGSVLVDGPAELVVTRSGDATTNAQLGALARRIREARGTPDAGDTRELSRFVLRVLALTALTACGWLLVEPGRAFPAAAAVLVVACPCAFALTAPATLTRALGALAARGVLVTNGAALAALARADQAWFDKTGTLTTPQFDAASIEPLRGVSADEALHQAGALAGASSHPLARALCELAAGADAHARADRVEVIAGGGIAGEVDGRRLRLGHAAFALGRPAGEVPAAWHDALVLADGDGALAVFHRREELRADAKPTLDALRAEGIHCAIASGDQPTRVAAVAAELGVDDWHAAQTPAGKLGWLQRAHAQGAVTLAVGDGSNDAALLAAADVSAAVASGTALAQANADLLLLHGRLDGLALARRVARDARAIGTQSRRWALVYNLAAVPFAALGFVPPWLAAIGMSVSSIGVVLNTLRVGHGAPGARTEPGA